MPKNNLTYRRGEIRWVKLDPTVGAETKIQRINLSESGLSGFKD
jgi:hypothetical protein